MTHEAITRQLTTLLTRKLIRKLKSSKKCLMSFFSNIKLNFNKLMALKAIKKE